MIHISRALMLVACSATLATGTTASGTKTEAPMTGGACSYQEYKGICEIRGIVAGTRETSTDQPLEITYSFQPEGTAPPTDLLHVAGQKEDGNFVLMEQSGKAINAAYAQSRSIAVYNTYTCSIHLIQSGTCVPAYTEIDGLD